MTQLDTQSGINALFQSIVPFERKASDWKVSAYRPYWWQREFHDAGATYDERAVLCANQVGKSVAGTVETSYHLTGVYPDWWKGRRFSHPVSWTVCGITNKSTRDYVQIPLFGDIDEKRCCMGGQVPRVLCKPPSFRQCGVPNVIDEIKVQHVSGGFSTCTVMAYEMGWTAFQGFQRDGILMDEEPEGDKDGILFGQIQKRLLTKRGILMFTRTPLFGLTPIVDYFWNRKAGSWCINVGLTVENAPHLTQDQIDKEIAKTRSSNPQLYDAVIRGIPRLGSGLIYNVPDEMISCEPFKIPDYYRRIVGIDLGVDHPTTAAWLAHDAESDVIYCHDLYCQSGETIATHASAIKQRGSWIPVAWPHDARAREKSSLIPIVDLYRDQGMNMLEEHAHLIAGETNSNRTEQIITHMLERMHTGRFKVFSHLTGFFDEKAGYHRKDGMIVREKDDRIAACHYATMMVRMALTHVEADPKHFGQSHMALAGGKDYNPLAGLRSRKR